MLDTYVLVGWSRPLREAVSFQRAPGRTSLALALGQGAAPHRGCGRPCKHDDLVSNGLVGACRDGLEPSRDEVTRHSCPNVASCSGQGRSRIPPPNGVQYSPSDAENVRADESASWSALAPMSAVSRGSGMADTFSRRCFVIHPTGDGWYRPPSTSFD